MMDRGQWVNLARMPGLQPYTFLKHIVGFLMTTASQVHSGRMRLLLIANRVSDSTRQLASW